MPDLRHMTWKSFAETSQESNESLDLRKNTFVDLKRIVRYAHSERS